MDPAKMKVVDLRTELGNLGLDTKGNKPALVDRLKKALEARGGRPFADTTILDTSTEDNDDSPTPATRTRRRSSSARAPNTPLRLREGSEVETIDEEEIKEEPRDSPEPDDEQMAEDSEPAQGPQPVPAPDVSGEQEPIQIKEDKDDEAMEVGEGNEGGEGEKTENGEKKEEHKRRRRSWEYDEDEEKEWAEITERLRIKEKERLEREKQQAEEDARKLEEVADNPIKLARLKRKQEKKARWRNYYNSIAITNEVLAPVPEYTPKGKKDAVEPKAPPEPEIDDSKVTLSWYDSDLNQYLEVPELNSVVPLSEGAFAHAWAGTRATHGVRSGRVCYEVKIGDIVTTTETAEKEAIINGLRVGWSTDDSTLHLGEGQYSWGYESTGRAVTNSEFKEYGKAYSEKDVIGVYLDLTSSPCKISYTLNGEEMGPAFEFVKSELGGRPLFPHVLTKNMCYRVNLGYDRYNMLSKTKIVRNRIEIPIEEVLEDKRKREQEIKSLKEARIKEQKERREKEKREREERQRKKREEREKLEKEKKEKELQEKRDKGEEVPEDSAPKQNGDDDVVVVKEEPMDTEQGKPAESEPAAPEQPAAEEKPQEQPKEQEGGETKEVTEEQVLGGYQLDKRIKFVIRYTVSEELDGKEAVLLPGYTLFARAHVVAGPRRPATVADCEVILMVGMPGAGKTFWARSHAQAHPEKRYNILSTGALFDKMKVDCKPFRTTYEGKWDAMVSKCAKCVLKLLEMSQGRRRNYILDQTNVYPSAQRRKLKEFEGYHRVAVVIVTDEETYSQRQKQREEADGKEVPDGAIMDMKANFTLPEKCAWIDEVIYPELDEEEAKKIIEEYHKEAKAAGVSKEREKRERSPNRDGPPNKKSRDDRNRSREDNRGGRRDFGGRDFGGRDFGGRDRGEDRFGGGGGGGGRWGPAAGNRGGSGGRWGPPGGGPGGPRGDRGPRVGGGGDRWAPPAGGDRWGGPPGGRGGNDFGGGRDRDSRFGGPPGGRNDRGPGGPPRGGAGGPPNDRFGRDRGNRNTGPPGGDKRQGGDSWQGSGSWQRGGGGGGGGGGAVAGAGAGGGGGTNQNVARGGAGGQNARPNQPSNRAVNQKDGGNQVANANQNQNQQGWNQWAPGGWGGWGNWNQGTQGQAGWGNWGNWGNWPQGGNQAGGAGNQGGNANQQSGAGGKGVGGGASGNQASGQGQWPAGYTAQQWYQWQQWQQQQAAAGQWPGYGAQGAAGATPADQQAAWAQYYQQYGAGNQTAAGAVDKK